MRLHDVPALSDLQASTCRSRLLSYARKRSRKKGISLSAQINCKLFFFDLLAEPRQGTFRQQVYPLEYYMEQVRSQTHDVHHTMK